MTKIYIEHGERPWLPAFDSKVTLEIDRYNFPRIGIVSQDHIGETIDYLFFCAAGEEDDTNLWLYVAIDEVQAKTLANSYGPDVMNEVRRTFANSWVTGAIASEFKIIWSDCLDSGVESLDRLTVRFLERFLGSIRRTEREASELAQESMRHLTSA